MTVSMVAAQFSNHLPQQAAAQASAAASGFEQMALELVAARQCLERYIADITGAGSSPSAPGAGSASGGAVSVTDPAVDKGALGLRAGVEHVVWEIR